LTLQFNPKKLNSFIQKNSFKGVNSPESRANEILTKLDRDKNNFITEQEFVAGCLDDIKIRGVLMPTRL
jgi:Ca2+-binding EF-hand superfamily protein